MSDSGSRRPVGESAQPGVDPSKGWPSKTPVSLTSVEVTRTWCEFGEVGLDGAEALVGPVVVSVPLPPRVTLGAEFIEEALAADDLGFGLRDVGGEPVDRLDGGCLVLPAAAAQLGERPELWSCCSARSRRYLAAFRSFFADSSESSAW